MPTDFSPYTLPHLHLRRLGSVSQVSVTVRPDALLPQVGAAATAQPIAAELPIRFYQGNGWQLTYSSPATGELVRVLGNPAPEFKYTAGLSTYALRDLPLVRTLASVFTRLRATKVNTAWGDFEEYRVDMPGGEGIDADPLPTFGYYTNQAGSEQYVVLYTTHRLQTPRNPTGLNQVSVYEIVHVSVNTEVLDFQISSARHSATLADSIRGI